MAINWMGARANEARNSQLEEAALAAHERAMARRARFVDSNPGAVSAQEREAVLGHRRDQGLAGRERALRDYEMQMLRQRGENDFRVARERRLGMHEQGAAAAQFGADASRHAVDQERSWRETASDNTLQAERLRSQAALTQSEREWGSRERIAETESKSRVDAVDARGDADLAVEQERGKSAVAVARENRVAAAVEAAAARQERGDQAAEKRIAEMVGILEKDTANRSLTPQQKRAKALALLGLDGGEGGALSQFRK